MAQSKIYRRNKITGTVNKQNFRGYSKCRYTYAIRPFVEAEYHLAASARLAGEHELEFSHLENAHVLGQESTLLHTRTHYLMLLWAIRNSRIKEITGQLFRIVGAATKTAIGLVPSGNTGGTNVSPFQAMEIRPELAQMMNAARQG